VSLPDLPVTGTDISNMDDFNVFEVWDKMKIA
jgi:hypothetical protein